MTIPIFEYKKAAHQKKLTDPTLNKKNYSEIAKLAVNYQLQNYLCFLCHLLICLILFTFDLTALHLMFLPTQFLYNMCTTATYLVLCMHSSLVASDDRTGSLKLKTSQSESERRTQHSTAQVQISILHVLL